MTTKLTPLYDPTDPRWEGVEVMAPEDERNANWLRRITWETWPEDRDAVRDHLKIAYGIQNTRRDIEDFKRSPAWQEAIKHRPELTDLWDEEKA